MLSTPRLFGRQRKIGRINLRPNRLTRSARLVCQRNQSENPSTTQLTAPAIIAAQPGWRSTAEKPLTGDCRFDCWVRRGEGAHMTAIRNGDAVASYALFARASDIFTPQNDLPSLIALFSLIEAVVLYETVWYIPFGDDSDFHVTETMTWAELAAAGVRKVAEFDEEKVLIGPASADFQSCLTCGRRHSRSAGTTRYQNGGWERPFLIGRFSRTGVMPMQSKD
jgi:hypothetical protein